MSVNPPSGDRDGILDSINEGVFTVDLDWRITAFNRAAEKITGVQRGDAIGRPCCEVLRRDDASDRRFPEVAEVREGRTDDR